MAAGRERHTAVACLSGTGVLLRLEPEREAPAALLHPRLDAADRAVRRPVVHDDDFERGRIRLSAESIEHTLEHVDAVVGRDDD